jgi:hypothetical protein
MEEIHAYCDNLSSHYPEDILDQLQPEPPSNVHPLAGEILRESNKRGTVKSTYKKSRKGKRNGKGKVKGFHQGASISNSMIDPTLHLLSEHAPYVDAHVPLSGVNNQPHPSTHSQGEITAFSLAQHHRTEMENQQVPHTTIQGHLSATFEVQSQSARGMNNQSALSNALHGQTAATPGARDPIAEMDNPTSSNNLTPGASHAISRSMADFESHGPQPGISRTTKRKRGRPRAPHAEPRSQQQLIQGPTSAIDNSQPTQNMPACAAPGASYSIPDPNRGDDCAPMATGASSRPDRVNATPQPQKVSSDENDDISNSPSAHSPSTAITKALAELDAQHAKPPQQSTSTDVSSRGGHIMPAGLLSISSPAASLTAAAEAANTLPSTSSGKKKRKSRAKKNNGEAGVESQPTPKRAATTRRRSSSQVPAALGQSSSPISYNTSFGNNGYTPAPGQQPVSFALPGTAFGNNRRAPTFEDPLVDLNRPVIAGGNSNLAASRSVGPAATPPAPSASNLSRHTDLGFDYSSHIPASNTHFSQAGNFITHPPATFPSDALSPDLHSLYSPSLQTPAQYPIAIGYDNAHLAPVSALGVRPM